MADIRRHTRREADIVEAKVGDERVELEQKRERLPDASAGTEDSNLRLAPGRRVRKSSAKVESASSLSRVSYCLQTLTNAT